MLDLSNISIKIIAMAYLEKILFHSCLILIFVRPFISQLAFSQLDFYFTILFSITSVPIIAINKNKIKYNPIDFFLLLFILSLVISLISSLNLLVSLSKIHIILGYLLVFYLVRCIDKTHKEKILKIIIFSAVIICCYGIYQYLWGFRHVVESLTKNQIFYPFAYEWLSRKRVFAVFFSPNAFAGFLIMTLPLVCSIKYIQKNTKFFSKFTLFLIILLTINLLMTQSISAIFSLTLSFCLILLIKKFKKTNLFIGIIFGLIMIAIVFYIRNKTNKTFIMPLFSIEKRIEYYKEALSMIKQHLFFGIGLGNFKGKHSLFVHNSYLQIWIELGILGIISYVGIIFMSIKNVIKRISGEQQTNIYIPLFCALLAFTIHNLIDFTFFLPEVSWLWWVIIALIIS